MRSLLPAQGWSVPTALAITLLFAPDTSAQTLYGMDGAAATIVEFNSAPGGPCGAPIPSLTAWPYIVPAPCPSPLLTPTAPPGPGSFGDVAADRLTDTIYVTDGFLIEQYADVSPLTGTIAGTPLNTFPVVAVTPVLGPLTGLGMDSAGVTTGVPTLYATDGAVIFGIAPSPPGSCAPPALVVPPFLSPYPAVPGQRLTDVTVDPSTGSLLVCDTVGLVHSIFPGGAPGPYGLLPVPGGVVTCPLGPGLEGIAMDLATTPSALGLKPAFYVTDGFTVVYADVTGALATPTFYTPVNCYPTPAPLNGLAYAAHSNSYAPAASPTVTLTPFGQSSSPGPTFGITITTPAPAFLWLAYGANVPGPGFFCPPLTALGNPLYVDLFTPPGATIPLFAAGGPGATVVPLPVPGALPFGVELYVQVFEDLTPFGPGGPWRATNPIEVVFTAP